MNRGLAIALAVCVGLGAARQALAQIYPPKPGVELPRGYLAELERDPKAFRFDRAWIQKVQRIKENRERYIAERGFYNKSLVTTTEKQLMTVTGTVEVPVFLVKFNNTGADPYPATTLQTKLFDGPFAPQTLTQMYTEMSYGDITLTGTVYGWTQLVDDDTYYEGPAGCNGLCLGGADPSRTGELIMETLVDQDPGIDFGIYDNDGPDGVPNSGDDDGYADFVAFVHPEAGGECGNDNIWSHRWVVGGWTAFNGDPFVTDDPAAGGGFIRVWDYVIQPAFNCGGVSVIDIGVFAHEFGHALGLPDLYDTNGGTQGIGHWGLMGSGSWNTVTTPAHLSAWSKGELGWLNVVDVGSKKTYYEIDNVEFNRTVYRLGVMDERWRRMTDCAIGGSYSMRCGLTAAEAAARNWGGGEGYGNGWNETVSRMFSYDGSDPVFLQYDYDYDSELDYDYTYGRIEVNGTVSTFATYDGAGAGTANIDLTPYLTGTGASTYEISFVFESDGAWADEDYPYKAYQSSCGPFVFDDLSVTGGGESYATDFEQYEDGWAVDMTAPPEHFLVENRQPVGSDAAVWGGGGLVIWHIEQSVAHSVHGNTGGPLNAHPRGVAVCQADGLEHLLNNINRGDAGDPYPGATANMLFDTGTIPGSTSYNGQPSNCCVELTGGNGDPISANMSGGYALPVIGSHTPVSGTNDTPVGLTIDGTGFVKGASVELTDGVNLVDASQVEWVGKERLLAEVDLSGLPGGSYDLIVTNPPDGCVVSASSFEVLNVLSAVEPALPGRTALRQNYPNPFNPSTVIPFDVASPTHVTLKIYNVRGELVRTLVDERRERNRYLETWRGRNDAGAPVASGVYFYKLVAGDFQDIRKLVLAK